MEKDKCLWEKRKNGEGKGGKYLEKESIFSAEEEEKKENILRRKISFLDIRTENEKEQNIVKKDKFARVDGLKALKVVLADLKGSTDIDIDIDIC